MDSLRKHFFAYSALAAEQQIRRSASRLARSGHRVAQALALSDNALEGIARIVARILTGDPANALYLAEGVDDRNDFPATVLDRNGRIDQVVSATSFL
jgi:hypothetical protein